uniref:Uncharacterized protein n=1 Tax=Anguilla anguilla TaxID=7936 RepID=A0A0E9VN93_ANGAN
MNVILYNLPRQYIAVSSGIIINTTNVNPQQLPIMCFWITLYLKGPNSTCKMYFYSSHKQPCDCFGILSFV